ncbi:hypothetical protein E4U15_000690 [Claviceps sp. LM218 group G6]|nr:hypothetical protein E4U15_000690 [Claviceps sp. LM218 group G6]
MHAFSVVSLVVCLGLAAAAPVDSVITNKRDVQYWHTNNEITDKRDVHPDSAITDKRDVQYWHTNNDITDKRDVQYWHTNNGITDKRDVQ